MTALASAASTHKWSRRDLLGLEGLAPDEVRAILRRATELGPRVDGTSFGDELAGRIVATLFFENSTRTRVSFAVAATRLGAAVVDAGGSASSVTKGETLIDTARNVEAMGVDALVVRAGQVGAAATIAEHVERCTVINAGDGRHEHPTQGLLDAYALCDALGKLETFDLSGVRVAIVGDIVSSRVARSSAWGLRALGADVVLVGPPSLAPKSLSALGCPVEHDFERVIAEGLDAVMMLRIQFERHGSGGAAIPSVRAYRADYGLTCERAARLRGRQGTGGVVVMHPGPINRGVEMDREVADGLLDTVQSVVLRQVKSGVAVRMAALDLCVAARDRMLAP